MQSLAVDNCLDALGGGPTRIQLGRSACRVETVLHSKDNGMLSTYLPGCFPSPVFKQILFFQSTGGRPPKQNATLFSYGSRLFNSFIPTVRSYLGWRFCLTLALAYGSCLSSHIVRFFVLMRLPSIELRLTPMAIIG